MQRELLLERRRRTRVEVDRRLPELHELASECALLPDPDARTRTRTRRWSTCTGQPELLSITVLLLQYTVLQGTNMSTPTTVLHAIDRSI